MRFQLGVLIVLTAAAQLYAQGPLSQEYPPPGRLIDVGGRKLHLQCSGKGSPTVILMAGGGAFSIDWALVQPKVAEHARVCSYDRAGLAWSDPGPADETVEQTVSDLHTLLRAAGEKEPYLLVGASIGGIFIRAYQRAFPDEVAGLVFTNSSNRVGKSVKGKVGLIWDLTEDEIRSTFPLPPSAKGPAPTRVGEPFDRLPPDLQAVRLWLAVRLWKKWEPAKVGPESLLSWRKEFLREFEETDAGKEPPLGKLPVTVLSSGPIASESERQSRNGAAARLDFLSSNSVHITATGSGHEIHLYQPDLVVQAVQRAASAVRNRVPSPALRSVDEKILREYVGVYQWEPNAFVYLQMWNEFTGTNQLVAFDESGEVRTLYPTDRDRFFAGPGVAVSAAIESRIEFQHDGTGKITSLTWRRDGAAPRIARRVEIEKREDVRFSNGDIQLAGTLISPNTDGKHPAIILVHGSGPQNREHILPFARFLIRHGMAVLGYDKRGVGGSTGNWNTASFDDLAGDVVAAFQYLKTRSDVDRAQIGLLGVSQAGWIMPLAAVRAKDIAFLISVSGAGVPAAETTIDHARNEMTASGMPAQTVEQVVGLMKLQYQFARTGQGWAEYAATREKFAARMGRARDTFPGTPDHPYWQFIRRLYFYDPAPTLGQLQVPTLALFGELDNNIVAEKNKAAWEAALRAGGNRDYTLRILPKANHDMLEAKVGNNAEMASLRRFVPVYFPTIQDWLAKRIREFGGPS